MEDYKLMYERLEKKLRFLFAEKKAYSKTKDQKILKKIWALESDIEKTINPKPESQAQLEFLAR